MSSNPVPLIRKFSLVQADEKTKDEPDFSQLRSTSRENTWDIIDEKYRCIILAEAGAGKSYEMESRAKYLASQGKTSFYIRIEDIKDDFETSLEVGCFDSFSKWLNSDEDVEAWFFLDSVDEARLEHPRSFEKAIKHFNSRINKASQRAHIFISSRPYAWRFQTDQRLVEKYLPFKINQHEDNENVARKKSEFSKKKEPLDVYTLAPLTEDDIRLFANHRNTPEIDQLITELQQKNLSSIPERPFDLEIILGKWKSDQSLNGRLELLRYNINHGLTERNPDRPQRTLSIEEAQLGARILAAAVTLTGTSGIRIPEDSYSSAPNQSFLAKEILKEWEPEKIQALLELGIFNDVLYGQVRFRHREVKELLAAEWFYEQLQQGNSRLNIETLFFRTIYRERVITPRLRPILVWLLLFDDNVRNQVMEISPEIMIEGGDTAHLPLTTRQELLKNIVERIVNNEDIHSIRDNDSIARIAQNDLSADTLKLINCHQNNNDAIFFLGRLVWQGKMTRCTPKLFQIATSSMFEIYPRAAAIRAIMTCGGSKERTDLWLNLVKSTETIPRGLLAELLKHIKINTNSIKDIISLIKKIGPRGVNLVDALDIEIENLIKRISTTSTELEIKLFIIETNTLLEEGPYHKRMKIEISEKHAWLLKPTHLAINFIVSNKLKISLIPESIALMQKLPFSGTCRGGINQDKAKEKIKEAIPTWHDLNDLLFWRSVANARSISKTRHVNTYTVNHISHYWSFNQDRFHDVLSFIELKEHPEDKNVALSLALIIYGKQNAPEEWINHLKNATKTNPTLHEELNKSINSREIQKNPQEDTIPTYTSCIPPLKKNRCPALISARGLSDDQLTITKKVHHIISSMTPEDTSVSQLLSNSLGHQLAANFRSLSISYWRQLHPALGSEEGDIYSQNTELKLAIIRLKIEATETIGFPSNLSDTEIRHALRYLTWELNEFPSWLETIHKSHPDLVQDAITTELFWELENTTSDHPKDYILQKITYNARFLHNALTKPILEWMTNNEIRNNDNLRLCIQIISSSQNLIKKVSNLAQLKTSTPTKIDQLPDWYALWVHADATNAIPALEGWLSQLLTKDAREAAQDFITKIIPSEDAARFDEPAGYQSFNNPIHLKSLYLLMHQYIEGTNTSPFPRSLQEKGQAARESLLKMLTRIEGKAAHAALYQLKTEHPDPERHPWMAKEAYKRAEEDSDMTSWTTEDVYSFNKNQIKTPSNNRELYELAINQLKDLRDWLENGNDSPYQTWQKAGNEAEMRNLIAGVLNNNSNGRYNCAQEYELANSQRPDILIQAPNVSSPVPIELKLLDKSWSGPKLCERLENQLAGDYLREENARNGIMLLVWQGKKNTKRWSINNKNVSLIDLEEALREYWVTISAKFPEVDDLEVIVIDLTVRGLKSEDATPKS